MHSPSVLKTSRPHDYVYDPNYIVSGPRDHYKQLIQSKIKTAKYAVCPIYATMFSDVRNYPRKQYILRRTGALPQYIDKLSENKSTLIKKNDVSGADRHKYFAHVPTAITSIPKLTFASSTLIVPSIKPNLLSQDTNKKSKLEKKQVNKRIQTMYRESSAQTIPWQPDYKVIGENPELLKLDFLTWGCGLPCGTHEVQLIERARMKLKWELAMPAVTDEKSLEQRREIIDALERNEWIFREQEIQDIQDLRLELLENMLNELHIQSNKRTELKMRLFCEMKMKEKEEKLSKLKQNSNREKRRLTYQHKGILAKYHSVNVVVEHLDYKSELYAPLIRNGTNPKYRHQVISDHMKKYKTQYEDAKRYSTLPTWLDTAMDLKDCPPLPGTKLCIRETKWTTPVLKQLHDDLKCLRDHAKVKVSLRVKVQKAELPVLTPEMVESVTFDEDLHEAAITIEKVLRGRAAQILIYQGRDRCRELIDELRSNFSLLDGTKAVQENEKGEIKFQQRDEANCLRSMARLESALKKIGGNVIGTLLEFLNKELTRLLDERKSHALTLLIERERNKREAAEAGRRQFELRRRREHDEFFKQTVKVHQDTVDLYLQDIITEGLDFATEDEAKAYVNNMAEKVDEEVKENRIRLDDVIYEEEYIANLVHHFVIPEVEKVIVREKLKERQKLHLKTVHEEIYNIIETLPKPVDPALKLVHSKHSQPTDPSQFNDDYLQQYLRFVDQEVIDSEDHVRHNSAIELLAPAPSEKSFADIQTSIDKSRTSITKSTEFEDTSEIKMNIDESTDINEND